MTVHMFRTQFPTGGDDIWNSLGTLGSDVYTDLDYYWYQYLSLFLSFFLSDDQELSSLHCHTLKVSQT